MRSAYPANAYYGFEAALREHAGWARSVKALVPHGVLMNPFAVDRQLRDWPLPIFLPYSWMTVDIAAACEKDIVLSASPFVYLVDAVRPVPTTRRTPPGNDKVLYFPVHSTAVHTAEGSTRALQRLAQLRAEGLQCTVLVYWRDVELSRGVPFERAGFEVTTCGHRDDPAFTDRLVELILAHDVLTGDACGSHMFYGAHLGRPYFSLRPPWRGDGPGSLLDDLQNHDDRNLVRVHEQLPPKIRERYLEMGAAFGTTDLSVDVAAQRELSEDFLGTRNLLPREHLRNVFAAAERQDVLRRHRPPNASHSPLASRQVHRLAHWTTRTAARVRRRWPPTGR